MYHTLVTPRGTWLTKHLYRLTRSPIQSLSHPNLTDWTEQGVILTPWTESQSRLNRLRFYCHYIQ